MNRFRVSRGERGTLFLEEGGMLVCYFFEELKGTEALARRIEELLNGSEDSTINQIRKLLNEEKNENLENT